MRVAISPLPFAMVMHPCNWDSSSHRCWVAIATSNEMDGWKLGFQWVSSWPCCCTSWFHGKGHKWLEFRQSSRRVTMPIVLLVGDLVGNGTKIQVFEVLLDKHCISCCRWNCSPNCPPEVLTISACSRQVGRSGRSKNSSVQHHHLPSLVRHHCLKPNIPFMTVLHTFHDVEVVIVGLTVILMIL